MDAEIKDIDVGFEEKSTNIEQFKNAIRIFVDSFWKPFAFFLVFYLIVILSGSLGMGIQYLKSTNHSIIILPPKNTVLTNITLENLAILEFHNITNQPMYDNLLIKSFENEIKNELKLVFKENYSNSEIIYQMRKKHMILSALLMLNYENPEIRITLVKYVAEQVKQTTERIMKMSAPTGFRSVSANSTFLQVIDKYCTEKSENSTETRELVKNISTCYHCKYYLSNLQMKYCNSTRRIFFSGEADLLNNF